MRSSCRAFQPCGPYRWSIEHGMACRPPDTGFLCRGRGHRRSPVPEPAATLACWMGGRPMEARAKLPATEQRFCTDSFCVFPFLGGLREPVAPVAGARGLLLCGGEGEPGRAEQPPHTPVDPKAGAPAAQHQRLQHRAEHRHCHAHGERPRDASVQKTATTPGTVSHSPPKRKKRRKTLRKPVAGVAGLRSIGGWRGHRRVAWPGTSGNTAMVFVRATPHGTGE